MKVYGPYLYLDRSGKRRLLVNLVETGIKRSQSYPRYLMEQHLGRKLSRGEDVDHIDRDPLNNDLSNLRVLSARENRGQHNLPKEMVTLLCPVCEASFTREARRLREAKKKGCAGPFCGKRCSRTWQVSLGGAIGRHA